MAKRLAEQSYSVLISEDDWLAAHYPEQIRTFEEYLKFSALIRPFVRGHVQMVLKTGCDVIMDFPANTVKQRAWFKQLITEVGCQYRFHFIDLSNEQCLEHIAARRLEQPERAQFDNAAVFYQVTNYFEAPSEKEGLNLTRPDSRHA